MLPLLLALLALHNGVRSKVESRFLIEAGPNT